MRSCEAMARLRSDAAFARVILLDRLIGGLGWVLPDLSNSHHNDKLIYHYIWDSDRQKKQKKDLYKIMINLHKLIVNRVRSCLESWK